MDSILSRIKSQLQPYGARLVAVSKTRPEEAILHIYQQGHRIFGENRVQELVSKYEALPKDIEWHLIGHLQRKKVKYIAPFVHMIHSVDTPQLLQEINKQALRHERSIDVLLQFKIASEESKHGLDTESIIDFLRTDDFLLLKNIRICGVMGMATFTNDQTQVRQEFKNLKGIFDLLKKDFFAEQDAFCEISMGMSGDYELALEEGSSLVRVGSLLFN